MQPSQRHTNGIVFSQEYDSLAQWKIERGADQRRNTWATWIACMCVPPLFIVAILGLPFFIISASEGKKLQQEGEAEGGVGRGYRSLGSESVPANQWQLECGPNVRRHSAPMRPPAYLDTPPTEERPWYSLIGDPSTLPTASDAA